MATGNNFYIIDCSYKFSFICEISFIQEGNPLNRDSNILKGSYDAISSFPFSLECYKLFVHR